MYAVLDTLHKYLSFKPDQINKYVKKLPKQEYQLTIRVRKSTQMRVEKFYSEE